MCSKPRLPCDTLKGENKPEVRQDSNQVPLRNLDGLLDGFRTMNFLLKDIADRAVDGESEVPKTKKHDRTKDHAGVRAGER